MVLEVAILQVKSEKTRSFENDFGKASKYIEKIAGYISHSLKKCLEDNHKYLLQVEWETLEDHTIGFRESKEYTEWKKLLHHYYEPFPVVEHFV
ncbi:UNVERIFIED_CONTAM: hypothetical protein GTU68_028613 [Idotea baltica]|nr:hypothetical protein [Idotea baltica]